MFSTAFRPARLRRLPSSSALKTSSIYLRRPNPGGLGEYQRISIFGTYVRKQSAFDQYTAQDPSSKQPRQLDLNTTDSVRVLVVKDGDQTLVLHYGQMWRMQLYFWDSGYRAFTANVGVPSAIANSIKDTIEGES